MPRFRPEENEAVVSDDTQPLDVPEVVAVAAVPEPTSEPKTFPFTIKKTTFTIDGSVISNSYEVTAASQEEAEKEATRLHREYTDKVLTPAEPVSE